ncbi:MAG TPA: LacI family DNA-binding transcriptional regulator [Ilumatobacteraceae bacterium]|nr:LacI family DNA-binding transcriptional regulator [Ilumatobacteraceae bacterium]
MEDVAQVAGVSRALVSLVMRDSPRVSVESRKRVTAAASQLGYRPNLMARNLAARRTMTVGVLLNDLHNPWFAEVTDGIHAVAERFGYQLILASGRRSVRLESRALDTFLASRVDGIIVAGCRLAAARVEAVAAEVGVVSVGRAFARVEFGSVTTDDADGARLAVEHLYELGHRDIAHIDGGKGAGAAPRRTGYLRTMRRLGLADNAQVIAGDFTEEAGAHGAQRLLRGSMPTAIFTANDLSAVGAIDVVERGGLTVPDDIAVVGFDNTSLAALNHIGLTTIDQPRREMGEVAARMLIDAINDRGELSDVVMSPSLVVRRTSSPSV